jgi:hypothetical protein
MPDDSDGNSIGTRVVDNAYHLNTDDQIGEGTYGKVYVGTDKKTGGRGQQRARPAPLPLRPPPPLAGTQVAHLLPTTPRLASGTLPDGRLTPPGVSAPPQATGWP